MGGSSLKRAYKLHASWYTPVQVLIVRIVRAADDNLHTCVHPSQCTFHPTLQWDAI